MTTRPTIGSGELLAAVEAAPPSDSVPVVARFLADRLDARGVCLLLVGLRGEELWRVPALRANLVGRRDPEPLRGSLHEEVINRQRLHVDAAEATGGAGNGCRVLAPVTNRGDAIGLLELITPEPPNPAEQELIVRAAQALAYIITANRRFTDLYEAERRGATPTLAAEIQQNLLPAALSMDAFQASVAGGLEPATDIAGDTFDYSLDEDTLHVSITDAMGHNAPAALLATLVVSALRQARRARAALDEQAHAAHRAVVEHGGDGTVTGQLLRIDLATGRVLLVNAGHPWPLRLRDGRAAEVELAVDLPFGGPWPGDYRVQELNLRPGDRLVLFTDGLTERNTSGFDLPAAVERGSDQHPREAVRTMTRALRAATDETLLDDATVVCLDWHGPDGAPTGRRRIPG